MRSGGAVGLYTVDVDIGGTFTDGFFTDGRAVRTAKVPTTPHDVTEGFFQCLSAGAQAFGEPLRAFLRRTDACRLSTTLGTNLVLQRGGPKIGLMVTAGHERDLYGDGPSPLLGDYLEPGAVVGLREEVGADGRVLRELDREEVLAGVRRLVEAGARMVVASLRHAWKNPVHERRIREFVLERYPVHYLRSIPLQLATEVCHVDDDRLRTTSAAVNAYIHEPMARALYRAEDRARAAGLACPLLVVHASGGCARVAKTVALHTLGSGPAVATRGAAHLARLLGCDRVVTADMGGTSLDTAVVRDGAYALRDRPRLGGLTLGMPMIEIDSLAAGGCSIARVDRAGREPCLRVGPESAGASPGPACYGRGGVEPTVTDANLVLGFMDPDRFLGGRLRLDAGRARQAVERRVARALALTVEGAAAAIRREVNRRAADGLRARIEEAGEDPHGCVLFAFGGAGPLHACAVAERAGMGRVVAFPFGSVFSAFGSSTAEVQHFYRRATDLPARDTAAVAEILDALRRRAERDMAGEGFEPRRLTYALRYTLRRDARDEERAVDVAPGGDLTAAFRDDVALRAAAAVLQSLTLVATAAVRHWQPSPSPLSAAAAAPQSERPVTWDAGEVLPTAIYELAALAAGQRLDGPAVVEAPDTSYAVPPGWSCRLAPYGNLDLHRRGAAL